MPMHQTNARPGRSVWSTDHCPAPERLAYWREAVSHQFVLLETTVREPERFHGRIDTRHLGPLAVSAIRAAAQVVRRGREELDREAAASCYLIVQQSGTGLVSQCGRDARLLPGDAAMIDTRQPYTLSFDRDFEQINIAIPLDCLDTGQRDCLPTAVRMADVGQLVADCVELLDDPARPDFAALLAGSIVALLNVVACHPAAAADSTDLRRRRIEQYMHRHFSDPRLTADAVAGANHVSVRLLHKLFASGGASFGATLRRMRLEFCRRRLADGSDTILTIAMAAGYENLSSFSRAFRQQYGLAPGEYRAARRTWHGQGNPDS
jgi:AraC-like DNA-binding protein